jgi:hypothetical protein
MPILPLARLERAISLLRWIGLQQAESLSCVGCLLGRVFLPDPPAGAGFRHCPSF